jgi:hypothetical protein
MLPDMQQWGVWNELFDAGGCTSCQQSQTSTRAQNQISTVNRLINDSAAQAQKYYILQSDSSRSAH